MKVLSKIIVLATVLSSGAAYAATPSGFTEACCALAACCGLPCC